MNVDTHQDGNNNNEANPSIDPTPGEAFSQAGASAGDPEHEVEGADMQDDRIRQLEEEVLDYKDRFLRNLAEMDNMRRRQERERQDLLKYATEKLLQDLLPVLDSFEKATAAPGSDAGNAVIEGIRMVHKQLTTVLENHGLKAVEASGKAFDPNFHQAIQRVEADEVEQEMVKDEFQRGYVLNGRLVRPSMVSVWVPKSGS